MKSLIFFPLILVFALIAGCGSDTGSQASYRCPMQCEGEKTYDKAGNCPVCQMELEETGQQ